jgi:hypothetical protein
MPFELACFKTSCRTFGFNIFGTISDIYRDWTSERGTLTPKRQGRQFPSTLSFSHASLLPGPMNLVLAQ